MRIGLLALFAGVLSCQTATQITVTLRGVGVRCPSGGAPTIEQTGVLAKPKLQTRDDMSELSVLGEQCVAEGAVVTLGDIVLVPAEGPGPVEVLAMGALKIGDTAVTAEDCRAEYERLFGAKCEIGEGKPCESCIFARRSVAFVKHSKLEVTIDLEASCAGVICDPSQTCSRGVCVSAETECVGDGPCVLVNEPEGGAGAGGSGEGGGEPGVWATLWSPDDPATESCPGAAPNDVIAGVVGSGADARFHVLAAAGPCMLVMEAEQAPVAYTASPSGGDLYRAVAKGADDDFVSFGDLGAAHFNAAPPFFGFDPSLLGFSESVQGSHWDVAVWDTPMKLAWARSYPEGTGQIVPFDDSTTEANENAALYAVFPSETPAQPITFGAWGDTIASVRGGTTVSRPGNASEGRWSLWADQLPADLTAFQLVAVGGSTDRVHFARCSDSMAGAGANCDFGANTIAHLTTASPRKVIAIWGQLGNASVELYAVGQEIDQSPWLGRTSISLSAAQSTLEWSFTELPPEMVAGSVSGVESVWVGPTGGLDSVVVAGRGGVFKAHVIDLEFAAAP
jgi:hypothetical protein